MKTYLTPNDVAERLRVSPITVRQWAQKGMLRAELTPGGHRRFRCDDVLRFASTRGVQLAEPAAAVTPRRRVLIVDDDHQLARLVQELLCELPETAIELAHDGYEAGFKMLRFVPSIVVMDLTMQGLDGFAVCRRIKAEALTRHVRIIATAGYWSSRNVGLAREAGAEECLAKPLDLPQLLALVAGPAGTAGARRP